MGIYSSGNIFGLMMYTFSSDSDDTIITLFTKQYDTIMTDEQKKEFIVLYRKNINTDLHKKLFYVLKKVEKNSKDGGGFMELTAEEKKDFEETLDDLREQLKEETEKVSEKAEEKISQSENNKKEASAKPKGKRGRPAKAKPSVSEAPAKPKGKRGRPAKAKPSVSEAPKKQEKSKVESSKTIIVVGRKEYDIEDCKQAIFALKARKKQSAKTAKKYKTKKPAVKAAGSIETAIHQVSSAVTEKAESNPKQVIAKFREFKKKMNEAFTVLGKIISKSDVELLKKSLKDIDDVIEKYK
jgi:hypothetical protein